MNVLKPDTAARLERINRRFYDDFAAEFSRTRTHAWPGWERVFDRIAGIAGIAGRSGAASILDVGCGNGRFFAALDRRLAAPVQGLGIDTCAPLIADARRRLASLANLRVDLRVEDAFALIDRRERYDVIALMGVLHHIPGRETRKRLVSGLTSLLEPGGFLAATTWRFEGKTAPWREADPDLDERDLDEGDRLLRFGSGGLRFCHFASDAEARELFEGSGTVLEVYDADGAEQRSNRYWILRR